MLRSKRFFGFVVLATSCGFAVHTTGCGDDDARDTTQDSGTPDAGPAIDSSSPDTSTADAADAAKPAPVFLDPSEYADLFTIDPSFPYGVTGKHAADTTLNSATEQSSVKWGTTGPVVTTASYPPPTPVTLTAASWTIPADPTAAATSSAVANADQTDVSPSPFYGGDGFVALPFGPFALQSYTTGGPTIAGEVLLYAPSFTSIVSRAFADGFYSGVGLVDGTTNAIVYTGLSPLTAAAAALPANGNGLYAAQLCAGKLLPTGACTASHMLFGWAGSSGPVVADGSGNVFVAAPLGQTSGEVYAISKTQALGVGAATKATLATDAVLSGTASAAALAAPGATAGWLVTIGYGGPVYGVDYTSSAAGVVKGSHAFATVLTPSMTAQNVKLFSDPNGHLWLAVTTTTTGTFFELQKKP